MKIIIMFALFNTAHSGPLAYGICQSGCNAVWVACVAAAGGVAGVSTGGVAVPGLFWRVMLPKECAWLDVLLLDSRRPCNPAQAQLLSGKHWLFFVVR